MILTALNSAKKPFVKKQSTGRSAGVDFEIYRSGRENLTSFISDSEAAGSNCGRSRGSSLAFRADSF